MLTTKQINDSFTKCKMIAESIYGDKVPRMNLFINTRLGQRTLGQCRFVMGILPQIEINPRIPLDKLDNTMIHEMAHAICGPKEGHSYRWKQVGDKVGLALGQKVERLANIEWEYSGQKYTVSCPTCGKNWYKDRASRITQAPQLFRCKTCRTQLVCKQNY